MKTKELTELAQWKVGEEVVLTYPAPQDRQSIRTIDKITDGRGGTIYVHDMAFDIHGRQRGNNQGSFFLIAPMTPDTKEGILKKNRRIKLTQFNFNSLTFDQASDLVFKMREMGIVI